MSVASYGTIIYSVGAPVTVVAEPATATGLGSNEFQITEESRRLLSPETAIRAYDSNDDSEMQIIAIDYFNGVITTLNSPVGDVEVDAAFVTKVPIGGSKDYSYELTGDVLENTSFDMAKSNGGYRTRCYGLHDVTVSVSRYDDLVQQFKNSKIAREKVYIEIWPGGGPSVFKGWFVVETSSVSGEIGTLEEESLSFSLASISDQQGKTGSVFSFTDL